MHYKESRSSNILYTFCLKYVTVLGEKWGMGHPKKLSLFVFGAFIVLNLCFHFRESQGKIKIVI